MSLDNGFGGVIQINTVPGCKMEAESSVLFFCGDTRGIPALLQGPSVVDRSSITESLTHNVAALSQYCF